MSKNKSIGGSYYVRVRASGWYLWHQSFSEGKRIQEPVDKKAYRDFGFKEQMSVDEAKKRCVQLNKERSLIKEKIRLSAKRVTELRTIDETLFPQDLVVQFQGYLEDSNFGSGEHLKKIFSHFIFIQKMCNELRIQPAEYRDETKAIYKYFIKKKISPSYADRIVTLLNRWGKFVSKSNGSYFDEVDAPRARERSAIADSQQTKSGTDTELGVRTESLPLTPDLLKKSKDKLKIEQYNWLHLSVWLGLRPEEVELLKNKKRHKVEYNSKRKIQILRVYQSKLQSISEDKRWKTIPIIFPEQEICLELIDNGNFKRPLHKIVRKYVGQGITLYGGRKGFVDLMLSKGQKLEDISMWLGHRDISTTWQHYKDKQEIAFTPTEEMKLRLVK